MEFRHRRRDCKGLRRVATPLLAACLALSVGVLDAGAQSCDAPAGNSGFDVYCEALPTPGGHEGPGDAVPSGSAVGSRTARGLDAAGADGETVKRLAGAGSSTGDRDDSTPGKRASKSRASASERQVPVIAPSPATTAGAAQSAGLPYAIVLVIIVLAVGVATLVARRRRSRSAAS